MTNTIKQSFKTFILILLTLTTFNACQKDTILIEEYDSQDSSLFSTINFNSFKNQIENKNIQNSDINRLISPQAITFGHLRETTQSESFVTSIDSSEVLVAEKNGITSYTFKTLTIDDTRTTNYILAHDENDNTDEYYLTYEDDGSSKVIDPTSGYEATAQSRGSVWCPITEEQTLCTCAGHTADECGGCAGWETVTVIIGHEYCGPSLGEGSGGGTGSGSGSGGGDGEGTGGGNGDSSGGGNDLPLDGEIITKPLEIFDANAILEDCLGYNNSAYYNVNDLNNILAMAPEVRTAMANFLETNGCNQESTDALGVLSNYLLENRITRDEVDLTLITLSNDNPWTPNAGVYNGIASLAYTHTRTILSNGRLHNQFLLANGDVLSSSNYPPVAGSSELVEVLFYFSQETQLWYDFQEPSSYSPLTLDFLWDGFWSATTTAVRVFTPLEDIIILIDGKDLDGVEQSRAVAAGWILVDVIPGSGVVKALKLVKYGDEVIQVANAVRKIADDIYKSQKEIIRNVLADTDWYELDLFDNTIRKGNFGEMVTDVDLYELGYEPLHTRVDYIDKPLNQGIDGIFKNPQTGEFIIVETKFGQSGLSTLADGTKQMSQEWIEDRLIQEVGEEIAEEILESGYTSVLSKVSQNGDIQYQLLDSAGNVIDSWSPHN